METDENTLVVMRTGSCSLLRTLLIPVVIGLIGFTSANSTVSGSPSPVGLMIAPPVLSVIHGYHPTYEEDYFDRAVTALRQATRPTTDGTHHLMLLGLRQLEDPELIPLFSAISQSSSRTIRINGLLGLAEVSESGTLDTWRMARLESHRERGEVLFESLNLELRKAQQLQEILDWPDLEDAMEISVLSVLTSWDQPVDREEIRRLMTESDSADIRTWAGLLLMHLGETEGIDEALSAINELPASMRRRTLSSIFTALRAYPLSGISAWIERIARSPDETDAVRFDAIHTLLYTDVSLGQALWSDSYLQTNGLANQLRHVLSILAVADTVSPDVFKPVISDQTPLLQRLGQAGSVIASGSNSVDACLAVIQQHHAQSTDWVFEYADTTAPQSVAVQILPVLIEDTMIDGSAMSVRLENAVKASDALLLHDPDRLQESLRKARSAGQHTPEEAILLGASWSVNPTAMGLIQSFNTWSSKRAGSLSLLIRARYEDSLNQDDLHRLSLIFRHAGDVSAGYEAQAAWLYIKHLGRTGEALNIIAAEIGTTK